MRMRVKHRLRFTRRPMLTVAQRRREKTDGQRRALRPANSQAPSTKKRTNDGPA
jgi:hypothetical protein